ncbi:hypothetical protein DRO26_02950 [Candidatus Bathyarchaeota archaeon]|nr:MAG: hypothetical protein DRO26_02950 [Candidatus Bathyarchaeota archaeon]
MSEISLTPLGREEIHKLEYALLVGTLFRPEVLEELRNPSERLTWIDSLAVAASALAREKAKIPVPQIADELGRTEATIRSHLQGKTKAGELVLKTYEKFVKEGVKLELPVVKETTSKVEEKLKETEEKLRNLEQKIVKVKETLNQILSQL